MKMVLVEKNISQQGANLVNEFDSYYKLETNEFKHEKDSFISAKTLERIFIRKIIRYFFPLLLLELFC